MSNHHDVARWLDLTRPMDRELPIYQDAGYSDPPFEVTPWCDVPNQGYCVARVCLGTQTGTHIDAPRHFCTAGVTLEHVELDWLVGPYQWVDVQEGNVTVERHAYDVAMLFIRFQSRARIDVDELHRLLAGPEKVWVLDGTPNVPGHDGLHFHRVLAEAGKFLVEDLLPEASANVCPGGELIVMPLRWIGTSGSPCRVAWRAGCR